MADFLAFRNSFEWVDRKVDYNFHISNLNAALNCAQGASDMIFHSPDFYSELSMELFLHIWGNEYDDVKNIYPWIKVDSYRVLFGLQQFLRPISTSTLNDLSKLNNNHCGWIGLKCECPEILVYSEESYNDFHQSISDKGKKVGLSISANKINYMIQKQELPALFRRIDLSKFGTDGKILHGEQIHMHFKDEDDSALNIDGSWKHGGFILTEECIYHLRLFGFKLD